MCKSHALQTGLRAQTIRFSQKHVHVSLENKSRTIEGPLLDQMTHPGSANDLSKVDVHPVVTAYKMSIVRLTIFQFYQLGRKGNIYIAWSKLQVQGRRKPKKRGLAECEYLTLTMGWFCAVRKSERGSYNQERAVKTY